MKAPSVDLSLNPAQYRFLYGMVNPINGERERRKEALFCAGVGIGKTTLLVECAVVLAMLNPGVRGLIASHVLNHVRTEIVPRIIRKLKEIGVFKEHNKTDRIIALKTGAEIQYGSADRPDTLDGKDVGWCLSDETRYWPEESYTIFSARRRNLQAAHPFEGYLTTPEMNWLYDVFGEADDILLVRGSTWENRHNLQSDFFPKLRRRFSGERFDQYVRGQWLMMSGATFPSFRTSGPGAHIDDLHYLSHLPMHMGYDPGYNRPNLIFFQHLEYCPQHAMGDCIHIFDEISEDHIPTIKLAPKTANYIADKGWRRGIVYCDPAANSSNVTVGYSDVDVWSVHNFHLQWTTDPASRHIPNGIDAIRAKLKDANGDTSLYIDRQLYDKKHERGIVKALQRTKYPEFKEGRTNKDVPIEDRNKDALDSLRYLIVNLFPPLDGKLIAA